MPLNPELYWRRGLPLELIDQTEDQGRETYWRYGQPGQEIYAGGIVEERQIDIESQVILVEHVEEPIVTVQSDVTCVEYIEEQVVVVEGLLFEEDYKTYPTEEGYVEVTSVIAEEDYYYEERGLSVNCIVGEEDEVEANEEHKIFVVSYIYQETEVRELDLYFNIECVTDEIDGYHFEDEGQIDVSSVVTEEDYYYEEHLVEVVSEVISEDSYEVGQFDIVSVFDTYEKQNQIDIEQLIAVVLIYEEDLVFSPDEFGEIVIISVDGHEYFYSPQYELDAQVTAVGVLYEIDKQNYYDERYFQSKFLTKSILIEPQAPVIKGRNPRPGETNVLRDSSVTFFVAPGSIADSDGVDITTLIVEINGTQYLYNSPQVSLTGSEHEGYYVHINHDQSWDYEQVITVKIDVSSVSGVEMETEEYSFTTEWNPANTKSGLPSVDIYEPNKYDLEILTIDEGWVRQGVARYTSALEVWWGRYRALPFIDNLEMRVVGGEVISRGKEVLENGYLSVKVENGDFVPVHGDTVINLGPMFSHSKKTIYFRLLVPENAETSKNFVLDLEFEPQIASIYGRFKWGVSIYGNTGNIVNLNPKRQVYKAYVLTPAMWEIIAGLGGWIIPSPFWRGEDKQW